MARTESEMITKSPISVKLGAKEYLLPVLTIIPARLWRVHLNASLEGIADNFRVDPSSDVKGVSRGLTGALIQFPEKLAELIFLYREMAAAWDRLLKENLPMAELTTRFTQQVGEGLPECEDFPRLKILADSSEEQLAKSFSALMEVAYPFLPQLSMVTQVLRANVTQLPATAKYSN